MTARAVCAMVVVAACGGSELRAKSEVVGEVIATARKNGAERCAPVELAMAESHHDFADEELDQGDYFRAKQELAIAQTNADAALRKSPVEKCSGRVAQAPKPEPKPADRDGDGILDDDDACPLEPEDLDEFEDEDGCPDPDNDGDGLVDTIDRCPLDKEDVDQFEDDDGCPDCDNDGDGVLECPEVVDKCPDKPAKTADGCPEYKLVKVTKSKIELSQTVFFDTNKATIKPVSFALLNEVAQVLKDSATISVRIEGHTDSQGADKFNLALSKSRAQSVLAYLRDQGIDSSRMVSEGYGEDRPISDNRTASGRAQNRRVEFVIVSR